MGCECGGRDAPLGELARAQGTVEDSRAAAPEDWRPSLLGARFFTGDGVRTGPQAGATIALRGGGDLRMGPASLVRFGATSADRDRVALEAGEAMIETGDAELLIDTAAGPARLASGSRVQLRRDDIGSEFAVVVGAATIERMGAQALALTAGSAVALDRTGAIEAAGSTLGDAATAREAVPADAGAAADAGEPADAGAAADATVPAGVGDADERATSARLGSRRVAFSESPERIDLALPVGESATLHTSAVPVRVGVILGDRCPGRGVIELRTGSKRRYFAGTKRVTLVAGPGVQRYRVLCDEAGQLAPADGGGTLRVLRDEGRRRVVTRAPTNTIDADGRAYRVLYQNRKPTIEFRWPNPPASASYTLELVDERGRSQVFRGARPSHRLASGQLAEGLYRWQFSAANDQRSAQSSLTLAFDNAAPVAQLERAQWTDNGVEVRGVATVGASVTVDGVPLPLDGQYRFEGNVSVPATRSGVGLRIVRPGGDVHYYVRRAPSAR
jgi:hypothetical protein